LRHVTIRSEMPKKKKTAAAIGRRGRKAVGENQHQSAEDQGVGEVGGGGGVLKTRGWFPERYIKGRVILNLTQKQEVKSRASPVRLESMRVGHGGVSGKGHGAKKLGI